MRHLTALLALGLALFCGFGFLASDEPPGHPILKFAFGVVGLLCLGFVAWVAWETWRGRDRPGSGGGSRSGP